MGKQSRIIAQKAKDKQQQQTKKPKAVKTNLKRLNERVRDKIKQVDKLYENTESQPKKQEQTKTTKGGNQTATSSKNTKQA